MGWVAESLVTMGRCYVQYAPGSAFKAASATRLNGWLREHPRRGTTRTAAGVRLEVDTVDLIQRYLYLFGVWEPNLSAWVSSRLRDGDCVVDVGANVGAFSLLASRCVGPTGRVVAIEASKEFLVHLDRNVGLNPKARVRVVHAAVSDRQRQLRFTLASATNLGANSIVPYDGPAESTFTVAARPLPDMLTDAEIATARVVKVDVEGAEGQVVRGMESMLDRLRPDAEIAIEVTPARLAALGDSAEELLNIMARHGFHPYRLPNDYSATSYPAAIRSPARAVRLRGPVDRETELTFSRVDADELR